VAVSGRLQIRRYDDKDGIRRKAAEVVADRVQFLDRAKQAGAEQASDWGSGDDAPF